MSTKEIATRDLVEGIPTEQRTVTVNGKPYKGQILKASHIADVLRREAKLEAAEGKIGRR